MTRAVSLGSALLLGLIWLAALLAVPARASDPMLVALAEEIVSATVSEDRSDFDRNYEPDVLSAIKSANDGPDGLVLDFDYMTNSQDPDYAAIEKSIDSDVIEKTPTEAVVLVTFDGGSDKVSIEYHLRKNSSGWKIHDVVYPNGDFALRKTLKLP